MLEILNVHIFLYKQPHFRVEPRVAIKNPKMRLKVDMKLPSIFVIEAKVAKVVIQLIDPIGDRVYSLLTSIVQFARYPMGNYRAPVFLLSNSNKLASS